MANRVIIMTWTNTPTIFLPKPVPTTTHVAQANSSPPAVTSAVSWLSEHQGRVRSIKRAKTLPSEESSALRPCVLTIVNYLSTTSLGQSLSVLTQAGRYYGVLEAIIENELFLRQPDGTMRGIFVYGIVSVSRNSS